MRRLQSLWPSVLWYPARHRNPLDILQELTRVAEELLAAQLCAAVEVEEVVGKGGIRAEVHSCRSRLCNGSLQFRVVLSKLWVLRCFAPNCGFACKRA